MSAYQKDGGNVCLHDFCETWPDEGDVDMYRLAKTLHEAGYPYMLMPDHAPQHPDDAAPEGASMNRPSLPFWAPCGPPATRVKEKKRWKVLFY